MSIDIKRTESILKDKLVSFTREEIFELAKVKGTLLDKSIRKYIGIMEQEALESFVALKIGPENKDDKIGYHLQDLQSKVIGMRKVANLFELADKKYKSKYKDK